MANQEEKIVMGFDVSSSAIGFGVLKITAENEIQFLEMDYFKPQKTSSILDDLFHTRNEIQKLLQKFSPTHIAIEDCILFMKGMSSAQTITKLTAFNRMVCLACMDFLNRKPELFSVMTIRHGIKLGKLAPKKEEVPDLVSAHLMITFPWELNRKGNPKVENFDKADGMAVSLRLALEMTNRLPTKKKSKKKKK